MSLTPDQDAYFRARLGSGYDDFDVEQRLLRNGGVGFEPLVVVEVLQERLATMVASPLSFTIVGDYSENRADNVKLLQAQLVDAREEAAVIGVSLETVRIVQPDIFGRERALDTEEFLSRGRLTGGR